MASLRQLGLILEQAEKAEEQAMLLLQQATHQLQQQEQALTQLSQYRFGYLHRMRAEGQAGVQANLYFQTQHFVGKLDGLVLKQQQQVSNFQRAKADRAQQWQLARQKKEALQLLIDKQLEQMRVREAKAEQKLLDEFATNQFARRKLV